MVLFCPICSHPTTGNLDRVMYNCKNCGNTSLVSDLSLKEDEKQIESFRISKSGSTKYLNDIQNTLFTTSILIHLFIWILYFAMPYIGDFLWTKKKMEFATIIFVVLFFVVAIFCILCAIASFLLSIMATIVNIFLWSTKRTNSPTFANFMLLLLSSVSIVFLYLSVFNFVR